MKRNNVICILTMAVAATVIINVVKNVVLQSLDVVRHIEFKENGGH